MQSDTLHNYRAVFISDLHPDTECCPAERLLDLFRDFDTQNIYEVGGTTDGWLSKHGWPQPHKDVLQQSLRRARKGGRLIYIPGNHDEFLREDGGTRAGAVAVADDAVHVEVASVRDIKAWTPSCRSIGASQARAAR